MTARAANTRVSEKLIAEVAKRDAFEILKKYHEINPSGISKREEDKEVHSRRLLGDLKASVPVFDLYSSVFPNSEFQKLNCYNALTARIMLVEEMAERVWTAKGKKTSNKSFSKYVEFFMLFLLFPDGDELEKKILEYYNYAFEMSFLHDLTFEKLCRWISSSYCIDEEMVEWAYKLNMFKIPEKDESLVEKSRKKAKSQLKTFVDKERECIASAKNIRNMQVTSLNSENANRPVD